MESNTSKIDILMSEDVRKLDDFVAAESRSRGNHESKKSFASPALPYFTKPPTQKYFLGNLNEESLTDAIPTGGTGSSSNYTYSDPTLFANGVNKDRLTSRIVRHDQIQSFRRDDRRDAYTDDGVPAFGYSESPYRYEGSTSVLAAQQYSQNDERRGTYVESYRRSETERWGKYAIQAATMASDWLADAPGTEASPIARQRKSRATGVPSGAREYLWIEERPWEEGKKRGPQPRPKVKSTPAARKSRVEQISGSRTLNRRGDLRNIDPRLLGDEGPLQGSYQFSY